MVVVVQGEACSEVGGLRSGWRVVGWWETWGDNGGVVWSNWRVDSRLGMSIIERIRESVLMSLFVFTYREIGAWLTFSLVYFR